MQQEEGDGQRRRTLPISRRYSIQPGGAVYLVFCNHVFPFLLKYFVCNFVTTCDSVHYMKSAEEQFKCVFDDNSEIFLVISS